MGRAGAGEGMLEYAVVRCVRGTGGEGGGGGWNGGYYCPVGKKTRASKCGEDGEMAERLWGWSEEKVKAWL
jgi:hypothetical protein